MNEGRIWRPLPVLLLCIVVSGVSCVSQDLSSEEFPLEQLTDRQDKMPAPAGIVRAVLEAEKDGLEVDRTEQPWQDDDALIAVVPVELDEDGLTDFLAYPATLLPSFHGAHTTAFWVFTGCPDSTYRLVLSGRQDAVRILRQKTKGHRDIEGVYWTAAAEDIEQYQFNGSGYEQTGTKHLQQRRPW